MRGFDGDAIGEQRYKQTAAPVTGFVVLNFRQRCGRGPYSQRGGAVRQIGLSPTGGAVSPYFLRALRLLSRGLLDNQRRLSAAYKGPLTSCSGLREGVGGVTTRSLSSLAKWRGFVSLKSYQLQGLQGIQFIPQAYSNAATTGNRKSGCGHICGTDRQLYTAFLSKRSTKCQ
jgi:hypothetical protein